MPNTPPVLRFALSQSRLVSSHDQHQQQQQRLAQTPEANHTRIHVQTNKHTPTPLAPTQPRSRRRVAYRPAAAAAALAPHERDDALQAHQHGGETDDGADGEDDVRVAVVLAHQVRQPELLLLVGKWVGVASSSVRTC